MWFCIKFLTRFSVLWSIYHCSIPLASELSWFEIKYLLRRKYKQAEFKWIALCWIFKSPLMYQITGSGIAWFALLCSHVCFPQQKMPLPFSLSKLCSGTSIQNKEESRKEADTMQENKSPSNNSFRHISHFNWINCTENPKSVEYNSPGALSYYICSCLYSN